MLWLRIELSMKGIVQQFQRCALLGTDDEMVMANAI